jgi:hypothetical protein
MAEHHKDEKKMTGLLRKSIVPASDAKQEGCPEPDLLAAYCEHSLNASEIARVEEHFANCSRCQEELAAMVLSEPPHEKAKARQWNWRLVPLWVTPLAVAAAMFALWIARPSLENSKKIQPPVTEVAQMKSAPPADAQSLPMIGQSVQQSPTAPRAAPRQKKLDRASLSDLAKDKTQAKKPLIPPKSTFGNLPAAGGQAAGLAGAFGGAVGGTLSGKRNEDETKQSSDAPVAEISRHAKMARADATAARGATATPAPAPMAAPQATPQAPATKEIISEIGEKSANTINGAPARKSENDRMAVQSQSVMIAPPPQTTQKVETRHYLAGNHALQFMVYSPNVNVMWRASGQGRIEMSKDGGRNWQVQFLDAQQVLTAGQAPSTTVGWVVGHRGLVLLTTDGITWKVLSAPTSSDLVNVTATDKNHAGVIASDGSIFKTKDGGKTWQTK